MAYEKIHDLLDLAILMQSNREGISLEEIKQKYNVSRRTAERMRDMILSQFPQAEELIDGRQKRWRIPQGTLRDFIQFSAEEFSAIETARKLLADNNHNIKSALLEGVANKIKANIKSETYNRIEPDLELLREAEGFALRVGPKINIHENIENKLLDAILASKKIKICYRNKHGGHHSYLVNPYGFLYGNGHYLVAFHDDAKDYKYFMLNKITDVRICNTFFERDENFSLQKVTEKSFGAYREEPFEVEWLFSKEVATDAEQYIFHPSQSMIKNEDGSLTVKFYAGGKLEMLWHLYTWGKGVKVIKPTDWDPDEILKNTSF